MNTPGNYLGGFSSEAADPLRYDTHTWAAPMEATGILRSLMPDRVRILDVGCGPGSLTDVVTKGKEAKVFGIEPNSIRAQAARARGFDVFCGFLTEDYLKGRGLFDVVLFADVLEHVSDPAELLRLAALALKPEGIVLISVPNAAHWTMRLHLLRGRFDYTEIGIRDATHLRWFTLKTIKELLNSQGFEVISYKPAAGTWMYEYLKAPWRWLPARVRLRLIIALSQLMPTLFACQHVLKGRRISSVDAH